MAKSTPASTDPAPIHPVRGRLRVRIPTSDDCPGSREYIDSVGGSTVERWGDYNGISFDQGSETFWTVSQYSPAPDAGPPDPYQTRIAEVYFDESDQ